MYDLILEYGTIVNSQGQYSASIGVINGMIATIAKDLSRASTVERIDLAGHLILPGCIDSHMHLWEPGLVADPDFKDGTRAALAGGVTTIIDHPLTIPEVLNEQVFIEKVELGKRTSYTDFALHGGVSPDNLDQLEGMWQAGCTAFKIFMCESGSKVAGLNSGELRQAFIAIGKLGATAILHAENNEMMQFNYKMLMKNQRKDPMAFVEWRPPEAEIEAINRATYLMKGTGARTVFLHTTVPEGVERAFQARMLENLDIWVETCPHNLYLTTEHLKNQGPWVTFSPPVRDEESVEFLWDLLRRGKILTIGSDHGPVDMKLKKAGLKDIFKGQFGIPGAETIVPLMVHSVSQGKISLSQLASFLSENPARLYGLYPKKGCIQPGSDADFTVINLNEKHTLSAKNMVTSCGWTPYEGWELDGRVTHAFIRGKLVMKNGTVLSQPGNAQFVTRSASFDSYLPIY